IKRFFGLISILVLLMSCAPQIQSPVRTALPSTASEAQGTLIKFFELLNSKQYADADLFYGGDYEQLKIFSADTNPAPADHAKLWADACQLAGLQCLKVRTTTSKKLQGDTYIFQVEFSNPDGSLFVQGACCGSNETEMPPVSQFEYTVARNNAGKFLVMELPPYVP
ncbi:MAG: hypothetical protein ABI986_08715, partial [Chloroflexota bacterium]